MPDKTVKYQGKVYTIQWDKPGNPTKEEFLALIDAKEDSKETPGYLAGLKEGFEGLKSFGSDILTAASPTAKGSTEAAQRVVGGVVDPIFSAAQRRYELEKQKGTRPWQEIEGEIARNNLGLVSDVAGVTPAIEAAQKGEYGRAAGLATIPVVGAALGAVKPIAAARKANRNYVPPPRDIAPKPFGPELPPPGPGLEIPELVTTRENLIGGTTPLTPQPQRQDLGFGLRRQVSETASEYKQRIAEQRAAVEAADASGQKVKRPVVQPKPIGEVYNPVQSALPERVREPGMNQVVFQAILPDNIAGRSKYKAPTKVTNAEEAAVKAIAKIDESVPVSPEEANTIVNQVKDSTFRQVYDKVWTSISTRIGKVSPELKSLLHKTRTEGNRLGGEYAAPIKKVIRKLSKDENRLAYRILDGTAKLDDLTPSSVKFAVARIRQITEELGAMAEDSGVHITVGEGEQVPFVRRQDYAPHVYDTEFFAKNESSAMENMIAAGKTPEQAKQILDRSRQFGERYISPQHAREFNMPGYIEDLSAFEKYAYDMAERITQAKNFGVKDIADAKSPISQLVNKSKDPAKAHMLVSHYLDRGQKATAAEHRAAQAIVNAQVLTKLSLSAISQISDLAGVPVRTGVKNFAKGLGHTLTRYTEASDFATESGALAIMKKEILKDAAQSKFGNVFGLSKMEEIVRTVSATSGRAAIQDLFNKLKANPAHKGRRAEFARLLDQDIDKVLKQKELTDKQIQYGASRTVELINSIPDKLDLPVAFTSANPLLRIPFLFKRYAFTTTKNLAQAIAQDPKRIVPALLSYGLVGEMTGDIKEVIKSVSAGEDLDGIVESVTSRDDKTLFDVANAGVGNKKVAALLNRAQANLLQSWFLGMFGDIAEASARGGSGIIGFAGGPIIGDVKEAWDAGKAASQGLFDPTKKANWNPAKRAAVKRIPFVGPGLAQRIKPVGKSAGTFR